MIGRACPQCQCAAVGRIAGMIDTMPIVPARGSCSGPRAAGLEAASYAGHSLRSGLATAAAVADVPERVIAQQTGHTSMAVLRRYIRSGSLFRENAAARVGL
jgi:integrase